MSEPPPPPAGAPAPAAPAERRPAFPFRYADLPETGFRGITVALAILVAVFTLFTGTLIVAAFDPGLDTEAGRDLAQLVVALSLGGTAIGFAAVDGNGLGAGLRRLGLRRMTLAAVGLACLGWFVYVLISAGLAPLLNPEQEDVTRQLGTDEGSVLSVAAAGLLIAVAAPISEELFFRGLMFAALRRSLPLWPAALISSLVWASLHLGSGNLGVVVQLGVFGVVLAWLYQRSGTLWAPILAHAINNALAFTLLLTDVL